MFKVTTEYMHYQLRPFANDAGRPHLARMLCTTHVYSAMSLLCRERLGKQLVLLPAAPTPPLTNRWAQHEGPLRCIAVGFGQ